jgi:hypothetical protein
MHKIIECTLHGKSIFEFLREQYKNGHRVLLLNLQEKKHNDHHWLLVVHKSVLKKCSELPTSPIIILEQPVNLDWGWSSFTRGDCDCVNADRRFSGDLGDWNAEYVGLHAQKSLNELAYVEKDVLNLIEPKILDGDLISIMELNGLDIETALSEAEVQGHQAIRFIGQYRDVLMLSTKLLPLYDTCLYFESSEFNPEWGWSCFNSNDCENLNAKNISFDGLSGWRACFIEKEKNHHMLNKDLIAICQRVQEEESEQEKFKLKYQFITSKKGLSEDKIVKSCFNAHTMIPTTHGLVPLDDLVKSFELLNDFNTFIKSVIQKY